MRVCDPYEKQIWRLTGESPPVRLIDKKSLTVVADHGADPWHEITITIHSHLKVQSKTHSRNAAPRKSYDR